MKVTHRSILKAVLILVNSVLACSAQVRQTKSTADSGTTLTVVSPSTTDFKFDDGNSIIDPGYSNDGPDSLSAGPQGSGGVKPVGNLKESGPRVEPLDGWAGDWDIDTDTNVDVMAGLFHLVLDQGSVGYSFSIFRNGTEVANGAGGSARLGLDGSEVAFTTQTRIEVASLSKTITAMALLQALEDNGLSPFEPIVDYIPKYWVIDETISTLTFADLLSHHSGLLEVGNWPTESEYENIEASLTMGRNFFELGPQDGFAYQYNYQNVNYAIARYLLAYLLDPETMLDFEADYQFEINDSNPAGEVRLALQPFCSGQPSRSTFKTTATPRSNDRRKLLLAAISALSITLAVVALPWINSRETAPVRKITPSMRERSWNLLVIVPPDVSMPEYDRLHAVLTAAQLDFTLQATSTVESLDFIKPIQPLASVQSSSHDALIFVGSEKRERSQLSTPQYQHEVQRIIQDFERDHKPIATFGSGLWILGDFGVLRGKRIADCSHSDPRFKIESGADWQKGKTLIVDGKLVTCTEQELDESFVATVLSIVPNE